MKHMCRFWLKHMPHITRPPARLLTQTHAEFPLFILFHYFHVSFGSDLTISECARFMFMFNTYYYSSDFAEFFFAFAFESNAFSVRFSAVFGVGMFVCLGIIRSAMGSKHLIVVSSALRLSTLDELLFSRQKKMLLPSHRAQNARSMRFC